MAQGLAVELAISQPVPWRVRMLDGPPRLVLDVREVDWTGLDKVARRGAAGGGCCAPACFAPAGRGWCWNWPGRYLVASSEMQTGAGGAMIRLKLDAGAGKPNLPLPPRGPSPPDWALPQPADLPRRCRCRAPAPVVVVLDPGHGGIDPGAESGGQTEAELMLIFARELKEALVRDGRFAVVMTRDDDVFVPLETRISIARAAGADRVPVAARRCAGRGRGAGRDDLHPVGRGDGRGGARRWPSAMTATICWRASI